MQFKSVRGEVTGGVACGSAGGEGRGEDECFGGCSLRFPRREEQGLCKQNWQLKLPLPPQAVPLLLSLQFSFRLSFFSFTYFHQFLAT